MTLQDEQTPIDREIVTALVELLPEAWDRPVLEVEYALDDRGERPGVMFADWELIGVPHRITVGEKALKEGQVEYQHRRDAEATKVSADGIAKLVFERLGQP